MKEIKKPTKKTWYIAHNNNDVFHNGSIEKHQVVTTGQPYLEQFNTEEKMQTRLMELNG